MGHSRQNCAPLKHSAILPAPPLRRDSINLTSASRMDNFDAEVAALDAAFGPEPMARGLQGESSGPSTPATPKCHPMLVHSQERNNAPSLDIEQYRTDELMLEDNAPSEERIRTLKYPRGAQCLTRSTSHPRRAPIPSFHAWMMMWI